MDGPPQVEMYGKPLTKKSAQHHIATLVFFLIAASHTAVACAAQSHVLLVISFERAFDSTVMAIGGLSVPLPILRNLGRIRFFASAIVWPYFLSFAFTLGKKCKWIAEENAVVWEHIFLAVAIFSTGLFVLREIMWFIRGPPPSLMDATEQVNFGDCLPSNALLGGTFGINKHEAEDHRTVFVPIPARKYNTLPSGLCVLEHLGVGIYALIEGFPTMFICALFLTLSRLCSNIYYKDRTTVFARLIVRAAEVLWLWSCLWQESCGENSIIQSSGGAA